MYIYKSDFYLASGGHSVGSDEENTTARRFKDLDIPSSKFEVHA
jgi:hypothetical protein